MARVAFDLDKMTRDFTKAEKRQVPFALAVALNATAEDAQSAARTAALRNLVIRGASNQGAFQRAIVFNRQGRADSKRGKLSAEVQIVGQPGFPAYNQKDPSSGIGRLGQILVRQELGGVRGSRKQLTFNREVLKVGHIIPSREYSKAIIGAPRALLRKNLGSGAPFTSQYIGGQTKSSLKRKLTRGKNRELPTFKKGTRFYFATENGIFVRRQITPRFSEYQGLYYFKKQITLRPRLGFDEEFIRTASLRLPTNWLVALDRALSTAN